MPLPVPETVPTAPPPAAKAVSEAPPPKVEAPASGGTGAVPEVPKVLQGNVTPIGDFPGVRSAGVVRFRTRVSALLLAHNRPNLRLPEHPQDLPRSNLPAPSFYVRLLFQTIGLTSREACGCPGSCCSKGPGLRSGSPV